MPCIGVDLGTTSAGSESVLKAGFDIVLVAM